MKLEYIPYSFNADRYGIEPEELESLKLDDQVNLVIRKMQNYVDLQNTNKSEYDKKAAEAAAAFKEYQRLRGEAKGRADQARSQLVTFRKAYKDNKDLINKKIRLAKNEK